jgi:hypothetical protein
MEMRWCVYGIEIFVSFFSIWDVCVVVGRKMNVWQGNCQVKCARWKSHGGVAEGEQQSK